MEKLFFTSQIEGKEKQGDKEIYNAIANTKAIDRDNEIILPAGCENLTTWLKQNPVIFYGHAWMSYEAPTMEQLPIGRAVEAYRRKDGKIQIAWYFHDREFAQDVKTLVDEQMLNQTSIGFMPKSWVTAADAIEQLMSDEGIPPETITRGDEEFTKLPYGICTMWELLELSVVSIPSNREADILRSLGGSENQTRLAHAVKSLCARGARGNITAIAENDPEEQEAKATPARRRMTFAEKYQGDMK